MHDTLGLDWDGVISHFPEEIKILARKFSRVVIITLNRTITPERVMTAFADIPAEYFLEICPDDKRDDYAAWKAETCRRHKVSLMIDDDGYVVMECRSLGIPTLAVNASFVQAVLRDSKF